MEDSMAMTGIGIEFTTKCQKCDNAATVNAVVIENYQAEPQSSVYEP
ncbi:MAG: hypothetical protein GY754_16695 [bacterium]|nr:hypothetical protein [bacterium]